jgi:hypothetical protein
MYGRMRRPATWRAPWKKIAEVFFEVLIVTLICSPVFR